MQTDRNQHHLAEVSVPNTWTESPSVVLAPSSPSLFSLFFSLSLSLPFSFLPSIPLSPPLYLFKAESQVAQAGL